MAVLSEEIPGNKEGEGGGPGHGHRPGQFGGYGTPNFVMLPRIFIRHQMQDLTEAELKVMLYIFDHTWGYTDGEGNRKDADAISRSQFLNGIRRLDGTQLDRGAGVSDRSLDRALESLVNRGYIFRHRRMSPSGRSDTNIYELNRYGKPCLSLSSAPALPSEAVSASNTRTTGDVGAQAYSRMHMENNQGEPVAPTKAAPAAVVERQNETADPRKFTPLATSPVKGTPANLRPSPPANLRPTTPAKLPDTIENPNNKKLKQHTTQSDPQAKSGDTETFLNPDSQVCVSATNLSEDSEQTSSNLKAISNSGEMVPNQTEDLEAGPKGKITASRTASNPKDSIHSELTSDLLKAGVAKKEAEHLAGLARRNGHDGDYVKQALNYIDRQRSVHNREGLLIHLVKTNWQPPVQPQETPGSGSGSGSGESSTVTQMTVPLPPASSIRPDHLPGLIEIEKRNLAEATSEFERETACARLTHFQTIAAQYNLKPDETAPNSPQKKG